MIVVVPLIDGWSEFDAACRFSRTFSKVVGRDVKHALVNGGWECADMAPTRAHTSVTVSFAGFHSSDWTQESLSC